ncbi:MAG: hypothetical protein ACRELC_01560 [Gemmatimonadota bacterium]
MGHPPLTRAPTRTRNPPRVEETKMNKRNGVIVAVLVVALLVVLFLWQRDRESQDVNLDVDIGAAGWVTGAPIV